MASQIQGWLEAGLARKARWVLVCHDSFDLADYPTYVAPDDDPRRRMLELSRASGDHVHAVFDLTLPIEEQLREGRAWHLPPPLQN